MMDDLRTIEKTIESMPTFNTLFELESKFDEYALKGPLEDWKMTTQKAVDKVVAECKNKVTMPELEMSIRAVSEKVSRLAKDTSLKT